MEAGTIAPADVLNLTHYHALVTPAMEAGTIAPADSNDDNHNTHNNGPAMEAGTIAPADGTDTTNALPITLLQWRPGLLPRLTVRFMFTFISMIRLQWRPGLLPRLTLNLTHYHALVTPAMEAGTIAPADPGGSVELVGTDTTLQWRPGLLPRLTTKRQLVIRIIIAPAMEAGTIAPADDCEMDDQ